MHEMGRRGYLSTSLPTKSIFVRTVELPELLKGSIPSSIAVDVSSTGSNIVRDRTNCIHERLWRCGFLHADISARSSERRERASHSIHQQTGENPGHACFD